MSPAHRSSSLLACAMSLAVAGCFGTSRPARFYTLEPVQVRDVPEATTTDATLSVGPIILPDYVDRPQIVTRTGSNELVMAEFDRWGGSLDSQINASLVATLQDRLAAQQIAVLPWRSSAHPSNPPYRLTVSVSRFDGVLGQSVVLQARWELRLRSGGSEESLGLKEASVTEEVTGPGYDALVAAMQRALVRLGQQMGEGIATAKQVARAR